MPPPRKDGLVDRVLGVWYSKFSEAFVKVKSLYTSNKTAFTLAEVLITLGIIGVVAALTMPSLIADHREKETVAKLKKVYSTLSNAFLLAKEEYGTPDEWELIANNSSIGAENIASKFAEYMNMSKYCGTDSGCAGENYKHLHGSDNVSFDSNENYAKFILADGTLVLFVVRNPQCTENRGDTPLLKSVCAVIAVDINGKKAPNQYGYDFFTFALSKEGIVPTGSKEYTFFPFDETCSNKSTTGESCSAWVIYNENMDYLHCNDLSWGGKTKCK